MAARQQTLPVSMDDDELTRREGTSLGRACFTRPCSSCLSFLSLGGLLECREPIAEGAYCHLGRLDRFGDTTGGTRASKDDANSGSNQRSRVSCEVKARSIIHSTVCECVACVQRTVCPRLLP